MKKKDLPLTILNQINEFKNNFPNITKFVKIENCLIRYEDKDPDSDFFFQINSYSKSNNEFIYNITYKPTSEINTDESSRNLSFKGVNTILTTWGNIIKQYNSTDFFIEEEDPIIEFYTEEFYNEYKLLEDDADYKPFELDKQLLVSAYLEKSVDYIDKINDEKTRNELNHAKELAIKLNENLTELTKNEVVFKLSKFWAETRKKGLPIFKEIFMELAKELVKEFGKKMLGL